MRINNCMYTFFLVAPLLFISSCDNNIYKFYILNYILLLILNLNHTKISYRHVWSNHYNISYYLLASR